MPAPFLQKVSTLSPRTRFPTPIIVDPASSKVRIERTYPRILSSILYSANGGFIGDIRYEYRLGVCRKFESWNLCFPLFGRCGRRGGRRKERKRDNKSLHAQASVRQGAHDGVKRGYVVRRSVPWDRGIQQVDDIRPFWGLWIIRICSIQHPVCPGGRPAGAIVVEISTILSCGKFTPTCIYRLRQSHTFACTAKVRYV